LKNKKVVVFGGSGFLGSYVSDELTHRKYDVLIADLVESAHINGNQRFVKCDIMNDTDIPRILEEADFVYNFAGLADLDDSIHQPKKTIEQNVIGNINLLEAILSQGHLLKRYVYASSAYAFSTKGSFYGISKLASEKIIEEYSRRRDIPFTIIRYGSLYGERADIHNGVYNMLKEAISTRTIHHKGDGEEVREYIHASDAAVLSVDVLEDKKFINQHAVLTGVERMRQKDLLRMIQEVMNDDIIVTYSGNERVGHYEVTPYSYQPNTARKLVSNSFIDLGQGLVSCLKHIDDAFNDDN